MKSRDKVCEKLDATSASMPTTHESSQQLQPQNSGIAEVVLIGGVSITQEEFKNLSIVIEPEQLPTDSLDTGNQTASTHASDHANEEITPGMHSTLPKNKRSSGSRLGKALIENAKTDAAKEQAIRSCWPKSWPADIEAVRNQKKVDGDTRNKIIRTVKGRMVEAKLNTHADFDIAARIIMGEFKCFQSIANCGHAHVATILRKCYSNSLYHSKMKSKKKANKASTNVTTQNALVTNNIDAKQLMKEELAKAKPSVVNLKQYLDILREERVDKLKNGKMTKDHLEEYPALKLSELVFYEFEMVFGISRTKIEGNWSSALPKMKEEFGLEKPLTEPDLLTIEALSYICQRLCRRKKDHPSCILKIYDESTLLSDTEPDAHEAPYLIGVGDVTKESLSFSFYVDKVPIYSGQAMDTLVSMYCCYWIFNLSYQPRSKLVFMFVEYILFRERTVSPITTKATITNLLSDLQIA
ncbi:hypothetical protein QAD02_008475 [Eretmocerus hayati]|uniref:Uncharacterized protein n=1 Tax=Eretmocerus hayati TaxID=131215 RepID=A0ACC2N7W6_9HYME|nr:hypothetical protein QAD02_008475 [Eretmocerus hayati]